MSTPYAFAAVTAVIRQQIVEGLALDKVSDAVGMVKVSASPPDKVVTAGQPEPTQVNIYLHQVTPNPAWRNLGLPSRDSRGDMIAAQPLAVTLHYLVSTFGADMYVAEVLLGHTMRIMHESAVLTREAVRRALVPGVATPLLSALQASQLADQIELVKLTPTAIALEDMSRIWSALQAHYRTTVAYEATVVLIDPRARVRPALPALSRVVFAETLALPEIAGIAVVNDPQAPVSTDSIVAIRGERLLGAGGTIVRIGDVERAPADNARADEITLDLMQAPRPRAGLHGVTIVHRRDMGTPPVAHDGVTSNSLALILRPVVTAAAVANGATRNVNGVTLADGTATITATRAIGRDQRVELLLNETGAVPTTRAPRGYVIAAPTGNGLAIAVDEAVQLAIPYANVARGDYLVRLRVDGADSVLTVGGDGRFAGPLVTI